MARLDLNNKLNHRIHTCISSYNTNLNRSRGTDAMCIPSMEIVPADNSTMRNKALNKLDFPAPVLPTTPI